MILIKRVLIDACFIMAALMLVVVSCLLVVNLESHSSFLQEDLEVASMKGKPHDHGLKFYSLASQNLSLSFYLLGHSGRERVWSNCTGLNRHPLSLRPH